MKWTTFYGTEQELIEDLVLAKSDVKTVPYCQLVRGYGFVDSFKKYLAKHDALTPKQMTQAKRLAGEIFRNVHGEEEYWRKARQKY